MTEKANSTTVMTALVAGQLRATAARYLRDPLTRALIDNLLASSPRVRRAVGRRHGRHDHAHDQADGPPGHLVLSCDMLQDPHRDQNVVMFAVLAQENSGGTARSLAAMRVNAD